MYTMHISRTVYYRILGINLFVIILMTLKQTNDVAFENDNNESVHGLTAVHNHKGIAIEIEEVETQVILGKNDGDTQLIPPLGLPGNINEHKAKIILALASEGFSNVHLNACPDYNCVVTEDTNVFADADAVIFYHGLSSRHERMEPGVRNNNQYFVYFSLESPSFETVNEIYPGFYNLTMSFLRDSDIPCPYGFATKSNKIRNQTLPSLTPEGLAERNRSALWFVSHCNAISGRDNVANEMKRYMDVDVYGGCGTKNCEKGDECEKTLYSTHRFYLAFENSLCKDYLTEKLWGNSYSKNLVPVVLKRNLVQHLVPPNSFIAVDDFKSPKLLAKHLLDLMKDDAKYLKYFEWRKYYRVHFLNGRTHDWRERPWGFCKLCKLLWQTPRPQKVANVTRFINNDLCVQ